MGKAEEMDVLDRWSRYSKDNYYRTLFCDEELISLSERIFGHLPAMDALC